MLCATETPRNAHHWVEIALVAPFAALVRWYRVSQERRALSELPSERLEDIGLTREAVKREVERPFWDAALGR